MWSPKTRTLSKVTLTPAHSQSQNSDRYDFAVSQSHKDTHQRTHELNGVQTRTFTRSAIRRTCTRPARISNDEKIPRKTQERSAQRKNRRACMCMHVAQVIEYLIKLEDWGIVFFLFLLFLLSAAFERLLLSVELRPSIANCRFLFYTSPEMYPLENDN